MLDLKLDRDAVTPKDAATVILVRNAANAVEVFCVERSKQSRFMGGAIVFPGGKLDPSDASDEWKSLTTSARVPSSKNRLAEAFAMDAAHFGALSIAAARETLEEAALLHVKPSSPLTNDDLIALRKRLATDPNALRAFLTERKVLLDLDALYPFARWVTPTAESRRFDARFFVAIAPEGQSGAHDEHETMASFWATPAEVLRRWAAGEVQVAPPTHRTFDLLAACTSTADVIALAESNCLDPICPKLVPQGDSMALVLPGDPEHEIKEARVGGSSRYVMRGDRWLAEDAPVVAR